jgi:GNAT superfamily N-acetyltransferase
MGTRHVQQPAPERMPPTEMISANDASVADLHTVNQVVNESIASWGLPERVRRLATPSLSYNESDFQHMNVILLTNPERKGVAVAAWEEAAGTDMPESTHGVLIHGLYVVPEYQRRGLGSRLIELVAKRISEHDGDGMAVRAWRDSLAFFLSRGFTPLHSQQSGETYPRRLWKAL